MCKNITVGQADETFCHVINSGRRIKMRKNYIIKKIYIILLVSIFVWGVNGTLFANQKKNDAIYWYDMGILCSVYGNDKNAIRHFNRVIKVEPENSKAYFHRGVSYGEMGQYENSLSSINKAIEINPDNASALAYLNQITKQKE
jgi:tetratricopeptide (TPR) repeat protein